MSLRSMIESTLSLMGLTVTIRITDEKRLNHLFRNHQGVVDGAAVLARNMTKEAEKQDVKIAELKNEQAVTDTTLERLLRQRKSR